MDDTERGALVNIFAKKIEKVPESKLDDLTFEVLSVVRRFSRFTSRPIPGTSSQSFEVLY